MDNVREKVIGRLNEAAEYFRGCCSNASLGSKAENHFWELQSAMQEAAELLKAQELPDVKPEKLEERTTKWLDQMTAEERLEEIAAILDDWDGYRTAKGLAGLINEVWAYALYPVKAQESFQPFRSGSHHPDWCCGNCKYPGLYGRMKFCPECGKAVNWDG